MRVTEATVIGPGFSLWLLHVYAIYLNDNLIRRYNYYSCFIDKETEAHRLILPSTTVWYDHQD